MSYPPPDPYNPPDAYGSPAPDGTQPPSVPYPTDPPSHPGPDFAPYPPPPQSQPTSPYPPTSQFPPAGPYGAPPPPPGQMAGYGPPPPPPRKSNAPLIAVILAVSVLLCGGAVTATVLAARNVSNKAKEIVEPITEPTLPAFPTDGPTELPDLPGLPNDLPSLPNLPGLPTDLPGGRDITVTYQVTGDGPADIVYTLDLSARPKKADRAKLPWRFKGDIKGALLVSVTAVRDSSKPGKITCKALVNGKEVVSQSADGPYAAVSCMQVTI